MGNKTKSTKPPPWWTPPSRTQLHTLLHLAAWCQIGVLLRIELDDLFGGACATGAKRWGWAPCVTSTVGALLNDLPPNAVGSFIMGFLASSDVLSKHMGHTLAAEAPLAALPRRSSLQVGCCCVVFCAQLSPHPPSQQQRKLHPPLCMRAHTSTPTLPLRVTHARMHMHIRTSPGAHLPPDRAAHGLLRLPHHLLQLAAAVGGHDRGGKAPPALKVGGGAVGARSERVGVHGGAGDGAAHVPADVPLVRDGMGGWGVVYSDTVPWRVLERLCSSCLANQQPPSNDKILHSIATNSTLKQGSTQGTFSPEGSTAGEGWTPAQGRCPLQQQQQQAALRPCWWSRTGAPPA